MFNFCLLKVLTLKSSVGKSTSCVIPVKNAGNITARVKLKIEGDSQFSVKPSQLLLKPEGVNTSIFKYFFAVKQLVICLEGHCKT